MNLFNLIQKWLTNIISWLFQLVIVSRQVGEFSLLLATGMYQGFKDTGIISNRYFS